MLVLSLITLITCSIDSTGNKSNQRQNKQSDPERSNPFQFLFALNPTMLATSPVQLTAVRRSLIAISEISCLSTCLLGSSPFLYLQPTPPLSN